MSLQVAGGVAGNGSEFVLSNYIKIYSVYCTGAFCYLNYPELQTAANSNSIFEEIINTGSVGTVNSGATRINFSGGHYQRYDIPLIVKRILILQGSTSAAIMVFYYQNYSIQ